MIIQTPKISVIMPVYNTAKYLKEAIDSILNQTFRNFEFIIIDDASSDGSIEIIESFQDDRIIFIKKDKNTGYTNSLNIALNRAKGKYIARMDSDDISMPRRFELQIDLLEKNPEIGVCGSNFSIIGTEEKIIVPEFFEDIKIALLSGNCIAHPSVLIRKSVLSKNEPVYKVEYEPAEDYELWVRLSRSTKLYNIQEILLRYRYHNSQVSNIKSKEQSNLLSSLRYQMISNLTFSLSKHEKQFLISVLENKTIDSWNEINCFLRLKEIIIDANKIEFFNPVQFIEFFKKIEGELLRNYFLIRKQYSPKVYSNYRKMKKHNNFKLSILEEAKVFLKSQLRYKV